MENTGEAFGSRGLPDTGTTESIMNVSAMKVNNREEVIDGSRKKRIYAANKTKVPCLGTAEIEMEYFNKVTPTSVLVAEGLHEDFLISTADQKRMGILHQEYPKPIYLKKKQGWGERASCMNTVTASEDTALPAHIQKKLDALIEKYSDIFGDDPATLEPMKGPPMHIQLKQGVHIKPTHVTTAKASPLHLEAEELAETERLLQADVIRKVTWPTAWISPSRFIPKPHDPKSLRLITDLRGLNRYIERPVQPFLKPADLLARIPAGSRYFLKLDLVKGYYQVALDQESADLTTFMLPSGRYQYTRGVMGCSATNDIFLQRTNVAFSPVPDLIKQIDDLLVAQYEDEVYLARAEEVFKICREHNITLSRKKLQAGTKVLFSGFIVSDKGVSADPEKVAAIRGFKRPENLTELKSFEGLCVQLAQFTPDLAHLLEPFKGLRSKKNAYVWLPEHDKAFELAKKKITETPVLDFFDTTRPTELLTDAARKMGGLGFALRQTKEDGSKVLICCGSRSLTSAERNYSVIESECLGVVWAIKKCRTYLLGAPFTVFCDHKPLEPIINGLNGKSLADIENPRLQRLLQKVAAYTFEVQHIDGVRNKIADALSRAPVFEPEGDDEDDGEDVVCTAAVSTRLRSDPALDKLIEAANTDSDYQKAMSAVLQCQDPKKLPMEHPARPLMSEWANLGVECDLIVKDGCRIVVPASQRPEILRLLHMSHSGIVKTRRAAAMSYWWPGINAAIESMINNCEECQRLRPSQRAEKEQQTTASRPMESVSADLWQDAGKHFLVAADRHSGWPWVFKLRNLDAPSICGKLETIFEEHGDPLTMRIDGGPQFRSHFKEFCKSRNIKPDPSSPMHPESNGHSEATVKAVKHLYKKEGGNWEAFKRALRAFRVTPRADGKSPSMLFYGRTMRTELPRLPGSYDQQIVAPRPSRPDKTEFELSALEPGTRVRLQNPKSKRWEDTGTVTRKHEHGRSYWVDVDDGAAGVWRNRKYLKPLPT